MARIRDDVAGVFHTAKGVLRAGDEVPKGVKFDAVWLAEPAREDEAPSRNASTAEWQAFLTSKGIDFPEDAKRDELRELY